MFQLFKNSTRSASKQAATANAQASASREDGMFYASRPANAVDRLMAMVDYYMHCELDVEYDHAAPDRAREMLRLQIEQELAQARIAERPAAQKQSPVLPSARGFGQQFGLAA